MSRMDDYRKRAAGLMEQAKALRNPGLAMEFTELAKVYTRLAEQADRDRLSNIVYDPPRPKLDDKS